MYIDLLLRDVLNKQFSGPNAPPLYLLASVVRNVDGLDLDLFEQALKVRRNFIQVRPILKNTFYL